MMGKISLFLIGIIILPYMGNVFGTTGYNLVQIRSDASIRNGSIEIKCWNKSLNRAGRIEMTRHDLTNGIIQINFPNCSANTPLFPPIFLAEEWIYLNVTVSKLSSTTLYEEMISVDWPKKNGTTIAYNMADGLVRQDSIDFEPDDLAQSAFIQVPLNDQDAINSGPIIKLSTSKKNSKRKNSFGPKISYTPILSDINSSSPETDVILTVDFVVITRLPASVIRAAPTSALYLTNDTSVLYCPTTRSFVPSQLCQREEEKTAIGSDIWACPSKYLPAVPSSKDILALKIFQPNYFACLTAAELLLSDKDKTKPNPSTGLSMSWSSYSPQARHFSSDNHRMELTITFAVVAFLTATYYLLKCLCNKSDRSDQREGRDATTVPSGRETSRRPSDSHLQVYGYSSHQDLPSYEETSKEFYAPPSYDEIFKPFGSDVEVQAATDEPSLVTGQEENCQPNAPSSTNSIEFFIIPRPVGNTFLPTNGSVNYGFTHSDR